MIRLKKFILRLLLNPSLELVNWLKRLLGFEIRSTNDNFTNPTNQIKYHLLKHVEGVLHIGAHVGQEASIYSEFDLNVLWVEADPTIFSRLSSWLQAFPKQNPILALLGDDDVEEVNFWRTTNDGQSSSLFELAGDLNWPALDQADVIQLPMKKLDSLFENTHLASFPYWVIDVQGAELRVLQGAVKNLEYCRFLEVEVSTFNHYKNQPLFNEVETFLISQGFCALWRPKQRFHGNILFVRFNY